MKGVWLNFLALIIAMMTFDFHGQVSIDYSSNNQVEAFRPLPIWDLDPLKSPSETCTIKFNYIAQNFIPIVTIAQMTIHEQEFAYYLPIFSFNREKAYFLLI